MVTTLCTWFLYLVFYSFVGWLCETVYCSIGQRKLADRGFLNGPVCPIYGFGALGVVLLLRPVQQSPVAVFVLGMVLTSALEYLTSYAMEKLFSAKWWDYSARRFNLNGRVCLRNSLPFGVMAVAMLYLLHPAVERLFDRIPPWAKLTVTLVLLAVFAADLIVSVRAALGINRQLQALNALAEEIKARLDAAGWYNGEGIKARLDRLLEEAHSAKADDARLRVRELLQKYREESQRHRLFQRRLTKAFPNMRSTRYESHLQQIKESLRAHRSTWESWLEGLQQRTEEGAQRLKEDIEKRVSAHRDDD